MLEFMAVHNHPEDQPLLGQHAEPFSPLTMFTCTFEALAGNISRSHKELTGILGPIVAAGTGPVKALNSNFGHYCQVGYEKYLKRAKPVLAPAVKAQKQLTGYQHKPTPASARQRKSQGDATCFNSALELIIIPGPHDTLPVNIRAILENNPNKFYAVKSFPTTGQTQVPGVICHDLSDGPFIAAQWAHFLTTARVGIDPNLPVTIVEGRPIMVNFKFHLIRHDERVILNLAHIIKHLESMKKSGNGLPFPIREIKYPQDGQNMSFKFVCPDHGVMKKVRVNFFYRGKVNILGARDFRSPQKIYDFLSTIFRDNWDDFVGLKPLPDKTRHTTRLILPPRLPVTPVTPINITVAPENHLDDDSLEEVLDNLFQDETPEVALPQEKDNLFQDETPEVALPQEKDNLFQDETPEVALPQEKENNEVSTSAAFSSIIVGIAKEFGAEFGFGGEDEVSDDFPFYHVDGQNIEDHQEDSLYYDTI